MISAKAFHKDVFIDQERKLGDRRRSDTVVVSTINDADQRSGDAFPEREERLPRHLREKSRVSGLRGEYGGKAET